MKLLLIISLLFGAEVALASCKIEVVSENNRVENYITPLTKRYTIPIKGYYCGVSSTEVLRGEYAGFYRRFLTCNKNGELTGVPIAWMQGYPQHATLHVWGVGEYIVITATCG